MKKEVLEKMYSGVVELSEQKVELANLDEYNRSVFGDETWIEQLNDFITKSNDLNNQLQMRIEGGLFVADEAKKAINKTIAMEASLQKSIKDLGIDEPVEFKKNQEKIRKIQLEVNSLIKKLEAFSK